MPDLRVTVDGLELPNPFIIGSGPPGTNANVIGKAFDEGWGAVICKTVSLDASKVVNVQPRYARLRSEGRLIDPEAWEKCTLFDVNVTPKQMSVGELEAGLVDLAKRLYTEERKKARAAAFREQHRRYLRARRTERAA